MIAMALITSPEIIIADEPHHGLDVTIQAQVLNLMQELQRDYHGSMIFITHDLGTVAEVADRVHVMRRQDSREGAGGGAFRGIRFTHDNSGF